MFFGLVSSSLARAVIKATVLRVEGISFLVRTWFHCGHRGNRSCSELQQVSDVLCISSLLWRGKHPWWRRGHFILRKTFPACAFKIASACEVKKEDKLKVKKSSTGCGKPTFTLLHMAYIAHFRFSERSQFFGSTMCNCNVIPLMKLQTYFPIPTSLHR